MEWITKLWRGDYPLWQAFWMCYVLAFFAFGVTSMGIAYGLERVTGWVFFYVPFSIIWAVYSVIAFVGIWRSTQKYTGHRAWSIGARLVVVLGVLQLIVRLPELVTACVTTVKYAVIGL